MEINIPELLAPERIRLSLSATDKKSAIIELVNLPGMQNSIKDKKAFLEAIMEREELETTGIGDGIALPHSRTDAIAEMVVAFGRSTGGINYGALDNKPVHLIFLIAAPRNESTKMLKLLAKIARLLNNAEFRRSLLSIDGNEQVLDLIRKRER